MTLPSGSSGGNFVKVQVLLPAPKRNTKANALVFLFDAGKASQKLPAASKVFKVRKTIKRRAMFAKANLPLSEAKHGSQSFYPHQEKRPFYNGLFSIQAAGLVWHQCTCVVYGIAKGVWHHQRCILAARCHTMLRIDSIPQQVADSIHGFAVIEKKAKHSSQSFSPQYRSHQFLKFRIFSPL